MKSRPVLTLIAAVSADGFISTGHGVPWDLPKDREHFRSVTRGQWLLIGRRTYQEMLGWFQAGHHPLILTRNPNYTPPVGQAVADLESALEAATQGGARELFVCGGGAAYSAAMPRADRLILTHVGTHLHAGVPFPALDPGIWRVVSRLESPADAENPFGMVFAAHQRYSPQNQAIDSQS
ncbi:MAG TPA: dihydrofolate reductase [Verrucomicrobiales bacterium]|nr:dihydrofolate reductase [Verrucomicrobiales bacterium]